MAAFFKPNVMNKVYVIGNYFFLELNGQSFVIQDAKSNVYISADPKNALNYIIKGPNLGGTYSLPLTSLVDQSGTPYTLSTWGTFYRTNTGFNPAAGGSAANALSGWADYTDTIRTSALPLLLLDGVKVTLPNNAGTKIEGQLPTDVLSMYNGTTNKILGRDGDAIGITIEFKAKPLSGAAGIRVLTSIDIGGAVGEIYPGTNNLDKGNGVEHPIRIAFNAYTLGTWQANGGLVKIQAVGSSVQVYDIRYVLFRLHKAR